jgi:hypothetical protein
MGRVSRLPELADELVQQKVDVIVAAGAMAVLTASSNRSNSTSLITPSWFRSAGFLTTTTVVNRVRIVIFPKITDAPLLAMIESL